MKLLFDENRSAELCSRLADLFPDSTQVRLVGLTRASDAAIRDYAKANGFVIVSRNPGRIHSVGLIPDLASAFADASADKALIRATRVRHRARPKDFVRI